MISQYAAPTLHRDVVETGFRSFERAAAYLQEIEFDGTVELDLITSDDDGESEIAITLLWSPASNRYEIQ